VYKKKTISQLKKKISAPVLLLLYINDMINMTNFLSSLFADDIGLFLSNSSFFQGCIKFVPPPPGGKEIKNPRGGKGRKSGAIYFSEEKNMKIDEKIVF